MNMFDVQKDQILMDFIAVQERLTPQMQKKTRSMCWTAMDQYNPWPCSFLMEIGASLSVCLNSLV